MDPGESSDETTYIDQPLSAAGTGRLRASMADFAWGLQQRGHQIHVLSSDTPHLGPSSKKGTFRETSNTKPILKGSYEGGVKPIEDASKLKEINTRMQI